MKRIFSGAIRVDHALYLLLFATAGFALWSALQNRDLRQDIAKARFDLGHAQVGDWLPAIDLPVLQDSSETARLGQPAGSTQILYFFVPSCEFCMASAPVVERLYAGIAGKEDVQMYAVSAENADATQRYLERTGSSIPTVVLPGERETNLFRLNIVPMLFFLEGDGRIRYARYGMLTDRDVPPTEVSASINGR